MISLCVYHGYNHYNTPFIFYFYFKNNLFSLYVKTNKIFHLQLLSGRLWRIAKNNHFSKILMDIFVFFFRKFSDIMELDNLFFFMTTIFFPNFKWIIVLVCLVNNGILQVSTCVLDQITRNGCREFQKCFFSATP